MLIFKRGEEEGCRVPFNNDYTGAFKKEFPTDEDIFWEKSADDRVVIRSAADNYPLGMIIIEEADNAVIVAEQ